MRALVQRVTRASVSVHGEGVAQIGPGLLVFIGVAVDDKAEDVEWLARKIAKIRILADEDGKMNRSVSDDSREILIVSQFTLYASTEKGNRPSFARAASGSLAQPLFNRVVNRIEAFLGKPVETGAFGADMQIELVNDGPVTIWLDSHSRE